jgi:hypothetical protein
MSRVAASIFAVKVKEMAIQAKTWLDLNENPGGPDLSGVSGLQRPNWAKARVP